MARAKSSLALAEPEPFTFANLMTKSFVASIGLGMIVQPERFEGEISADIHTRIAAGLKRAMDAVDSGKATQLLSNWATLTQNLASN